MHITCLSWPYECVRVCVFVTDDNSRKGIADEKRLLWKFSDNWCLKRSSFLTMSPRLLDDN